MRHIQTQEEWESEMTEKILSFVRGEIYLDLRFLDIALSALPRKTDPALQTFATDGATLSVSPEQVLRVFKQNAPFLNRLYLHTVLHCIFSHLWTAPGEVWSAPARLRLWNIACDIAVEYTVDGMGKPCTRRILSWIREKFYAALRKQRAVSAAVIYRMLFSCGEDEVGKLEREFYTDDHRYWPKREDGAAKQQAAAAARDRWNRIARQTQMVQESRGKENKEGEDLLTAQLAVTENKRSYREFLRKFAVLREELHCDPDEFDLTYYTYGLKLYKNLPLIEPVETRESRKIREFVIAIDTSYSTSGELVQQFLEETVGILNQNDSFFSDAQIRILQCDNAVRSEAVIHSEADFRRFLAELKLAGGGGTDFRPVFSHVSELRKHGECKNLSGLLYFTDGKGIYPGKRPDFKTAFVFLEDYDSLAVPPWAMRQRFIAQSETLHSLQSP